ncbi:MAG: potassium transporter TrkG [Planctomycetota bacterium]|nr:hypothetical protein [Planctomycetota bacterium]MCX8040685.1 hypothetical protein [Planctomycetota bacterium]MDW8373684.1 potassium transporter TrkG [Planctomycetota bacterium]
MHLGVVSRTIGLLLVVLAAVGALPLAMDYASEQPTAPWAWMIAVAVGSGLLLMVVGRRGWQRQAGPREAAAITVGSWLALAAVAACGLRLAIPEATYAECWFEAMSGLTTCGASAFGERLPIESFTPGVKLWRALLQWMGGIGIIALGLVLLPMLAAGTSLNLFRSESSGLGMDRLTPRLADTVRFIVLYNLLLNALLFAALSAAGVGWFDALCFALTTVSTGGFANYSNGVTGLGNPLAEWVLCLGMLLGALNFVLVVAALRGQPGPLWRSEEVRAYFAVLLLAAAAVALILSTSGLYDRDPHAALRHAAFAVVSIGTSSGHTLGFDRHPLGWEGWPAAATVILLALMLGVGCSGSTAGGIKMQRLLVLAKMAGAARRRFIEPAVVAPLSLDGRPLPPAQQFTVITWVVCAAFSWFLGTLLLVCLAPVDLASAGSMVLSALTNVGPAFGAFGPSHSAQAAGPLGMVLLSLLMLLGRLEFLAVIALLSARAWRR